MIHGRKLGRELGASAPRAVDGFRTLNLRFGHPRPAAGGIFVVRTARPGGRGAAAASPASACGPRVDDSGRVLLEVHCLEWPDGLGAEGGYGKLVRVELLHKLRDEARFDGLEALSAAIRQDADDARAFFAAHAALHRQTTRDRIRP